MTFKNCQGKTISELFVFCEDLVLKRIGTELLMFGCNSTGIIGNNSTTDSQTTTKISACLNWSNIEISRSGSSLAIKTDGTLWSWGLNNYGQLGLDDNVNRSSPTQISSENTIWASISSYGNHSAAIKLDGTLWTWGKGSSGNLGNNDTKSVSSPIQTLTSGNSWKNISTGCDFTSAIKTDGTLWGWGLNNFGSLANNSAINHSSPVQTVSAGTNWKVVSSGLYNTLGIKTDGTLWGWGDSKGLGIGEFVGLCVSSPVQTISGGTNWKKSSTSGVHSISLKTDGSLWMWGCNDLGQLGNGCLIDAHSPTQICSFSTNWRQVKASYKTSAAINSEGHACLWGKAASCLEGYITGNTNDLLVWGCGISSLIAPISSLNIPKSVYPKTLNCDWIKVSSQHQNVAAIRPDNSLFIGGCNDGKIGNGGTATTTGSFENLCGSWCDVFIGVNHVSGIKTDGTLWTWGCGAAGGLGDNSTISKSSPVQTISGGTDWKSVNLSRNLHSAAIKTNGSLWLWGCGQCGVHGNNSTINRSSPVQTISGGTNWCCVAIGRQTAIAIKTDGSLWAWGWNGCGKTTLTTNRSSPVQILAGSNNSQVSMKADTVGTIRSDGSLWLWGWGQYGVHGNNSVVNRSSPVQTVSGGTDWCSVVAACTQTGALKTDGTLWMWGCNGFGSTSTTVFSNSSPIQLTAGATCWKSFDMGGFQGSSVAVSCNSCVCFPKFSVNYLACVSTEIKGIATNGNTVALLKYKED
jgi:alpha-tubulin suppressor-like RCC1 family protein